ncbi:MAG: rod shape-determining protein MreD [Flavobacterium sp. BFFFF2]|nr:MAG: rod shape-determining protein MreD [Flavobacterium sp. BFFFF2]
MNSTVIGNTVRFILLLILQVLIFSQFDLFGFINPYPYVLFILLYPVNGNQSGLLLASFFMGLSLDFFNNSGGVNAAACVILAQCRPALFKFSFGLSYEYQTVKINDELTPERFIFILLAILIHHTVLFSLEIFNMGSILDILLRVACSTVFTLVTCLLIIYLIRPAKR